MFSDIEGSTELNERVGDRRWLAIVRRHNSLIRDRVAAHRGAVVKSRGDGFMLVFDAPGDAVACAVALQRAFDAAPDPDLGDRVEGDPQRDHPCVRTFSRSAWSRWHALPLWVSRTECFGQWSREGGQRRLRARGSARSWRPP